MPSSSRLSLAPVLVLAGLTLLGCKPEEATGLSLSPPAASLEVGQTVTVKASLLYASTPSTAAKNVLWTTSNKSIVSVETLESGESVLTARAVGVANIRAAVGTLSAEVIVTVKPSTMPAGVVSLQVAPMLNRLPAGSKLDLVAEAVMSDGSHRVVTSRCTWATSDAHVAIVDSSGHVLALAPGRTQLSATFDVAMASVSLEVTPATLDALEVTPSMATLARGTSAQFTATGVFSDGSRVDQTNQVTWSAVPSLGVSVSSTGLVTALDDIGFSIVTATLGTVSAQSRVTVTSATLSALTVMPAAPTLAKGTTVQLSAIGTFSDTSTQDLTAQVTWSSSSPSVATVTTSGLASALTVGNTDLTATLGAISHHVTLTVTAATLQSISVTPAARSLAKGTTQAMTATGIFTDASTQDLTTQVMWTSSAPSVAPVSNAAGTKGLVTALAVGTATLTASSGTISGSTGVTVTPAELRSLAITPPTPSLARGRTQQLTATGTFSDTTTQDLTGQVTWGVSSATIATVSNAAGTEGLATAANVGSTTVTATLGMISTSVSFQVTAAVLTSLSVTPSAPSLALGRTLALTATGTFSDSTTQDLTSQVTWNSSASTVASVSNAGLVTSLALGATTVSATLGAVSGSTQVTVTPAVLVSLTVTPAVTPSLAVGLTHSYVATGVFSDGTNQDLTAQVTWSSSSVTVASVSNAAGSRGLTTALAVGTTSISATLSSITGSSPLTVSVATLVSVQVTPITPSTPRGRTRPFTATGTFTDASTQDITSQVTWASSASAVASISNAAGTEGLATAVTEGTTTISATLNGRTGSTLFTVTAAVLVSLQVTPTNPTRALGIPAVFQATGLFSDNSTVDLTGQVTWSSSQPTVADVSNVAGSQGEATTLSVGSTTVTATSGTVSASTTLTVTAAVATSVTLAPLVSSVSLGLARTFVATAHFTDGSTADVTATAAWSATSAGGTAVLGAPGAFTGTAVGDVAIVAEIAGPTGPLSGVAVLTVTSATLQSIDVTPAPASLPAGLTAQFTAIGHFSDASTQNLTAQVTWASSNAVALQISNAAGSQGLATGISLGGPLTVSATLGAVSGSAQVTVTGAVLVSLSVTPVNPSLARGLTRVFTATGTFSDASTQDLSQSVTWSSSDVAVATVSNAAGSQGLATAVTVGSTTITAQQGAVSASTTLSVTPAVLMSITIAPGAVNAMQLQRIQLKATGLYSDSTSVNVTALAAWGSTDVAVATVGTGGTNDGRVDTLALAGTSTITATIGAVVGSTLVTVNALTCHLVINELQVAGTTAADEWVELYNPCTNSIDTTGMTLQYRAAGGTTDTSLGGLSGVLAAGAFRLHANVNAAVAGTADLTYAGGTGTLAGAGGGVAIKSGTTVIDSVGYGTATNAYVETTVVLAPASGRSVGRSPFDGKDSNSNVADFVNVTLPTPKSTNFP